MDDFTAMMIDLAESRRKTAVAMRDAGLKLAPAKLAELDAEIAACDAELAELRNGQA